jgi:hypothetical protein
MHHIAPLLALGLVACQADTGFSGTQDDNNEIEGNGKLEITPTTLEFPDLEIGIASSELIKVTSVGDNTLKLYTVDLADSGGGVFYMEEESSLSLAPGTVKEFTVVATAEEEGLFVGEMRLKTNDIDNLDLRITTTAWTPGYAPTSSDSGASDSGTSDGGSADGGMSDSGGTDAGR